jgi:hypothetical protein
MNPTEEDFFEEEDEEEEDVSTNRRKTSSRMANRAKPKPRRYQSIRKEGHDRNTKIKERFLYLPFYSLPDLSDYIGELIEVRIASEYLSTSNKALMERRIWGSDIYTSDSDAVCVLQHSGYFKIKELQPTNCEGVQVFLRVSKGRATYNSSQRNGIKSKKLNSYQGHSIKPEGFHLLKSLGNKNELLEMASRMPSVPEYVRKKPTPSKLKDLQENYYNDFNMVFNLSNEMWLAYSLPAIVDKGKEFKEYTSWKLKDKVLYVETHDKRYEIVRNILDHTNDDFLFEEYETFRFSEVKEPFEKDNDFILVNPRPLKAEHIDVVFPRLDWHSFQWGEDSLLIQDVEIRNLKAFNFYNIKQ